MPEVPPKQEADVAAIDARVRPLADLFAASDLVKLRVRDDDGELLLRGNTRAPGLALEAGGAAPSQANGVPAGRLEVVSADLVGVMHFARPVPAEGTTVYDDLELGYVEALGIRNPVRSRGPGRIVAINVSEGQPVDFGQALFTIDRNV